jgi:hypothetical protein
MLEQVLLNNLWLDILIWIALYISDYQLTIVSARLYQTVGREFLSLEGSFELTPFYERDVDALRRVSPRFLAMLTLQCLAIFLMWTFTTQWSDDPALFSFVLGALFLLEVVVHVRHVRNLVTFHYARRIGSLKGRLERARWFVLRLSAVDLAGYALLFLLVFLLTGSWFFLGGTTSCLVTAAKHWHQATKALAPRPETPEGTETLA